MIVTPQIHINIFDIPKYNLIAQSRKCGRKGGLFIYLHENYKGTRNNIYKESIDWEGLFIDVTSPLLPNKIIIGNVYRPPRDNYSNASIDKFIKPFSEIILSLRTENSALIIGGDFNINLLCLNERAKFQEFYDIFVTNSIFPEITLPTRFSKQNATLIDQIFCRYSKHESHNKSGIMLKKISDHLPCFSAINIHNKPTCPPKFIKIRETGPNAMEAFRKEILNEIEKNDFDPDLLSDPNTNYAKLENIIRAAQEKWCPVKEVKFNKYKHKIAPWITQGILNSMKFRNKLYVKWKKTKHQVVNTIC